MTAPFVTSADLAAYLRYPSGSMDEALANMALEGACQAVADYLQQEVTETEELLLMNGNGSSFLFPPVFPIQEVTSITDTDGDVIEDVDWAFHTDNSIEYLDDAIWIVGDRNYRVLVTYGYEQVPATIKVAALQVAARIYEMGIVTSDSVGGVSTTVLPGAGQLNEQEMLALINFRRLTWR